MAVVFGLEDVCVLCAALSQKAEDAKTLINLNERHLVYSAVSVPVSVGGKISVCQAAKFVWSIRMQMVGHFIHRAAH